MNECAGVEFDILSRDAVTRHCNPFIHYGLQLSRPPKTKQMVLESVTPADQVFMRVCEFLSQRHDLKCQIPIHAQSIEQTH